MKKNNFWYMNLVLYIVAGLAFISLINMAFMYLVIYPEGDVTFRIIVAIPLMFFLTVIFGIRIVGEILTNKIKNDKRNKQKDPSRFFCILQFNENIIISDAINELAPTLREMRFKVGTYQGTNVFLLSSFITAPKILRLTFDDQNRLMLEAFCVIIKRRSGDVYEEDFDGFYDALAKHKFKNYVIKIINELASNDAKIIDMSEVL